MIRETSPSLIVIMLKPDIFHNRFLPVVELAVGGLELCKCRGLHYIGRRRPEWRQLLKQGIGLQCVISSVRPIVLTIHELLDANYFAESTLTPASVFH